MIIHVQVACWEDGVCAGDHQDGGECAEDCWYAGVCAGTCENDSVCVGHPSG